MNLPPDSGSLTCCLAALQVGVSEGRLRKWLLSISAFLRTQASPEAAAQPLQAPFKLVLPSRLPNCLAVHPISTHRELVSSNAVITGTASLLIPASLAEWQRG